MPVYAFDYPPYQYVRLAPGIGADIALVGPLPDGGFEQLLGSAQLLEGLRQSRPVQLLLDLSALGDLGPGSLRWMATSLASGLVEGGAQHLAVVLPTAVAHFAEELRNIAAEQNPTLVFACFPEQAAAVRWLATRVAGVGAATSPEEVGSDAQQGRLLEAVARYRAMFAAPLATAVEFVDGLRAAPRPEPQSLIPSTEQPPAEAPRAAAFAPTVFETETGSPADSPAASQPGSDAEKSAEKPSFLPHAPQATTQASLGEQAASVLPREPSAPAAEEAPRSASPHSSATATEAPDVERLFDEEWTVARQPDVLFPKNTSTPEEDFVEARQRGSFDTLLRSLLSKAWFVSVNDKGAAVAEFLDTGRCVQAFDESRPGATTLLGGARLSLLLQDSSDQVRFSPGSLGEVTLRKHQLAYARSFLAGLRVETLLPSLTGNPESRQHCLNHSFYLILEPSVGAERAATTTAPGGGLAVQLFTLPDALLRYLQSRPESLRGRKLGVLAEQGDLLLEKLLTLPIEGAFINAAGPGEPLFFTHAQLEALLRPADSQPSAPQPSAPSPEPAAPSSPVAASVPPAAQDPAELSATPPPIEPAPAIEPATPEDPAEASPEPPRAVESAPGSEPLLSVRDADLHGAHPVLRARSIAEAHFYLDARGQSRVDRYQWSETRGADTVWIFQTRGHDNQQARFEFLVNAVEPGPQGGYFGEGPSPLLGPVELLQLSGAMAQAAAGSPNGLSRQELEDSTRRMELAYILVMEALRFFGPEDHTPPAASLKTEDERRTLQREPERFARARIEEVARSYWLLASQLGEALRGGA